MNGKRWIYISAIINVIILMVIVVIAASCSSESDQVGYEVYKAASGSAEMKTCQANRRTVVSAANTYAASEESYPTAMTDLYPNFIDDDFNDSDNGYTGADGEACPSGGTITWNWDKNTPPRPVCSIHGEL